MITQIKIPMTQINLMVGIGVILFTNQRNQIKENGGKQ